MAQNPPSDLLALVAEVRAEATQHLSALAGNASMCAIGRSGQSFPAAKYHEGRQSAAGDVRRALRRGVDPADTALEQIQNQWRATLAGAEAKGPDWVAYASGGLDALAEIAGQAQAPTAQPNRPEM